MSDLHIVILAAGQGTRMKSALPKVLHPVSGRPMVGHVVQTAAALSPASIIVIVGHSADAVQAFLGSRPGRSVRTAGAPAWNRPRAPAGRAAARRTDGHRGPAFGGRAPPEGGDPEPSSRGAPVSRSGRDGRHRFGRTPLRLRPHASGSAGGSHGSSRNATPRRRRSASRKSTAVFTRSTWPRCSTACGLSPPRTPRASTT